mgnify:FL=1
MIYRGKNLPYSRANREEHIGTLKKRLPSEDVTQFAILRTVHQQPFRQ